LVVTCHENRKSSARVSDAEEGTASTFRALLEVFTAHGLPSSLYTDRGSHYFHTPQADGPVDRAHLTQVGRALKHHFFTGRGAGSTNAVGMSARAPDRIGTTSQRRTTWT